MGHERVGILPKSKKWQRIINDMATPDMPENAIESIASQTLDNVRERYALIKFDRGVQAAFQYLVLLAISSRENHPQTQLQELGINVGSQPNILAIVKAAHKWIANNQESLEYSNMAAHAAGDALAAWQQEHQSPQLTFFDVPNDPFLVWRAAGDGSGFCELSRLFFAKLTERYLNYFLEREASAVISTVNERQRFNEQLANHIQSISKHAFETSKITQSFAAGWFNKNTKDGMPDSESIEGFLAHAFEKIREELLLERQSS